MKYISKKDFHSGKDYALIVRHIDTCLTLIERLISYNKIYRQTVSEKHDIPNAYIDYRVNQFDYYDNLLKSIYYSCFSLKYVYEISTYVNFKNIENTIGSTLDTQRRDITFSAIVKLSSIFEYTRKVYEQNIKSTPYFENLKIKYGAKVESLELLNNFRNTVHSNGKWDIKKERGNLRYSLAEGQEIEVKPGETFKYTHWKLYRIIKDCLELNKIMALENEEIFIRETRFEINGQKGHVVKTNMTLNDWENLIRERYEA